MKYTLVTEALPPALVPVLLIQKYLLKAEPFVGVYAPARTLEYEGMLMREWEHYDEVTDTYYRHPGFYERIMNEYEDFEFVPVEECCPVIAWAEIPEFKGMEA